MKQLIVALGVAALCCGAALGQAPAPRPSFDIAGIQVSTRPNPGMRGGMLRGTRYELRNATMADLIRTAYNVQPEKITGGPSCRIASAKCSRPCSLIDSSSSSVRTSRPRQPWRSE
jgi:hypothetical protein